MQIDSTKAELLMARAGMTKAQLAEKASISAATLSNILSRGTCAPKSFLKIATALEVEPGQLTVDQRCVTCNG